MRINKFFLSERHYPVLFYFKDDGGKTNKFANEKTYLTCASAFSDVEKHFLNDKI